MKKLKKIGLLAIFAIGLVLSAYGAEANVDYDTAIFRQEGKISIVIKPKTAEITIATFINSTKEVFSDQEITALYNQGTNQGTVEKISTCPGILANIWPLSFTSKEIVKKYQVKDGAIVEIGEPEINRYPTKNALIFILWFVIPLACIIVLSILNRHDKRKKLLFFFGGSLIVLATTIYIGQYYDQDYGQAQITILIGYLGGAMAGFFLGDYVKKRYGATAGFGALTLAGAFTGVYSETAISAEDFRQVWLYLVFYAFFCLIGLSVREIINALSLRAQVKRAGEIAKEIGNQK